MTGPALSVAEGAAEPPLLDETIGQAFDRVAARWPDRPALVSRHQNIRWNYAELKARVDTYAAAFMALGLAPGERIGI